MLEISSYCTLCHLPTTLQPFYPLNGCCKKNSPLAFFSILLSRDSIFLAHRTMFWYPFFKPRAGMLTFCCIYLDPIKIDYFRVRVYAWNFCTVFRRAPGLHPFCFMGHCKACCKKLLGSADRIKSSCISSINLPGIAELGNAGRDFLELHYFASLHHETFWGSSWVILLWVFGHMEWGMGMEGSWMGIFVVR